MSKQNKKLLAEIQNGLKQVDEVSYSHMYCGKFHLLAMKKSRKESVCMTKNGDGACAFYKMDNMFAVRQTDRQTERLRN